MLWVIIIPAVVLVLMVIFGLAIKRWRTGGDSMTAWNGDGEKGGESIDEKIAHGK